MVHPAPAKHDSESHERSAGCELRELSIGRLSRGVYEITEGRKKQNPAHARGACRTIPLLRESS
jgi:hypothetical protein